LKKELEEEPVDSDPHSPAAQPSAGDGDFQLQVVDPGKAKTPQRAKPKPRPTGEAFDRFWQAYPKRKDKADAHKAFMRLSPEKAELAITRAAELARSYERSGRDLQFCKYPGTWLNKRCYEDEVQDEPESVHLPNGQVNHFAILQRLKEGYLFNGKVDRRAILESMLEDDDQEDNPGNGSFDADKAKPTEEQFERCWDSYPKREGKAAARAVFMSLSTEDAEKAVAAAGKFTERCKREGREVGKIKLLANWLTTRGFEDFDPTAGDAKRAADRERLYAELDASAHPLWVDEPRRPRQRSAHHP
jgi:hypothetical protein